MFRTIPALLLLALAGAAYADNSAAAAAPAATSAPQTPAADATSQDGHTGCVGSTGTHLAKPPGDCKMLHGDSYSRDRLESTGMTETGDALKKADPALR
jgi:hypothetical protein